MYKLIKDLVEVDSDYDLGIMISLCHLNRQIYPEGAFRVVDDHGNIIWPAA